MTDDPILYTTPGDRPVCEDCQGTGVIPAHKGLACLACEGAGRVGLVAPAAELEPVRPLSRSQRAWRNSSPTND